MNFLAPLFLLGALAIGIERLGGFPAAAARADTLRVMRAIETTGTVDDDHRPSRCIHHYREFPAAPRRSTEEWMDEIREGDRG